MGVSGCGKTSVGESLSRKLGWPLYDGDDFHPQANVDKMASGIPLKDADRSPWLATLNRLIGDHLGNGKPLLLACSALKQAYRQELAKDNPGTVFVYLKGDFDLIFGRMQARSDHYMKAEMLQSQFETLEEPQEALVVNTDQSVESITAQILQELGLESG
jgi:gluconokinase